MSSALTIRICSMLENFPLCGPISNKIASICKIINALTVRVCFYE